MSSLLADRAAALAPSIIRVMNGRRKPTSIDLSLGQPALPPDEVILDRAIAAYKDGPPGYTHNAGLMELRTLVAEHHALRDWRSGENAIVAVGSEEAVFLALICSAPQGSEILIPEPGYPAYPSIARLIGAQAKFYPIRRDHGLVPRADLIRECITDKTRVLLLNGPSNPFGAVDERDELQRIADLVEEHNLVVISDEIYRDLTYTGEKPPSICELTERSILVSGLSKSCALTGFRLGYLIADQGFVGQATLAHQVIVTCAARISQLAAIEIFKEPERLVAHLPYYEEARQKLRQVQQELPSNAELFLGNGAFYAILDVSHYAKGDPMALALELLEEEDVVVVPGTAFGPSGDWFWRLSYAAGAGTTGEGLSRIVRFLRSRA